jgi:hypothetical protein
MGRVIRDDEIAADPRIVAGVQITNSAMKRRQTVADGDVKAMLVTAATPATLRQAAAIWLS